MQKIEYDKLPAIYAEIISVMTKINPDLDELVILNMLNSKMSHIVNHYRISLYIDGGKKHLNYYGLSFSPSGRGKDKCYGDLNGFVFPKFKENFIVELEAYKNKMLDQIEIQATYNCKTEAEQKRFIKEQKKEVRNLLFEIGSGTPEGLYADCEALKKAGFGGIFVNIEEIGLYLKNPTQPQELFLNDIIKLYEGKLNPTTIKSNNDAMAIEGVPCTCIFYSDPSELIDGDNAKKYLETLFQAGLIRRSFVCYQKVAPLSTDIVDNSYYIGIATNVIQPKMENIINKIKSRANDSLMLSKEAQELINEYRNKNKIIYNKTYEKGNRIQLTELIGRFWKATKLAGLLALVNHPDSSMITAEDICQAIYQSELFGDSLQQFFNETPITDADRLALFFFNNAEKWITTMDLRKQKFVNSTVFSHWFRDVLPDVVSSIEAEGFTFEEEQSGKNGKKYRVVRNQKIESTNVFEDKIVAKYI